MGAGGAKNLVEEFTKLLNLEDQNIIHLLGLNLSKIKFNCGKITGNWKKQKFWFCWGGGAKSFRGHMHAGKVLGFRAVEVFAKMR